METITRNIRDISPSDRIALEHVIGKQLADNQKVVIQISDAENDTRSNPIFEESPNGLPEWCNVYSGLSNEQIKAIEQTVLTRANLSRTTD